MKKNIFIIFASLNIFFYKIFFAEKIFAQNATGAPFVEVPKGSIDIFGTANQNKDGVLMVLELVQRILLTVVLPIVAVGTGIYIAYTLLTAEGDESKMKTAWKSLVFSGIAMLVILFSAFVVRLIASININ